MAIYKLSTLDEIKLAKLWTRFKAGDEQAFEQLVRMRYRALYSEASRFTKNRELIKDCLQELMLELWHRRANVVDTPYVTVYLMKALRNNLFRLIKKETNREVILDEWESKGALLTDGRTRETDLIGSEVVWENEYRLQQLIDKLPARQKEAIVLKFYEGYSNETIAQLMKVDRQTVANFLYRALGTMKSRIHTPM
ncbi:sigma-70 family RNA polymerase sigma factor [Spirosoma harenae]